MMILSGLRRAVRLAAGVVAVASGFSMIAADLAEAGRLGRRGGGAHARYSTGGGGARTYRSAPRAPSVRRDHGGFSGGRLNQRDRSRTLNQRQGRTADRQQVRRDLGNGRQELRGDRGAGRQDGRTDRTGTRQENRTNRVSERSNTRREIADDIADNNYWAGHHHYHDHDYWGDDAVWAFFGGLAVGAFIASLPPRYETIVVSGTPYYYANGSYYVQSGNQYQVVAPPVGATVENAPTQITNVYVNGEEYGYSNGAYYEAKPPAEDESDPTFEVAAPPVGATVTELPEGTEKKTVNGNDYFVYAGTWYQPFYSGTTAVYVVVEKPA